MNLDKITSDLTAFGTFAEMTHRGLVDDYSPTLSPRPARRSDRIIRATNEAKAALADAFDAEMIRWGSHVRAFRG